MKEITFIIVQALCYSSGFHTFLVDVTFKNTKNCGSSKIRKLLQIARKT